jgi:tetratricopeptide (TPR) repeat protein
MRISSAITDTTKPYPGPRPFLRTDSEQFFGRKNEAAALAEMWRANRLTIASGPTGSGKTSLLLGGVLPLVEGGRAEVLPPGRITYGSTFPTAALPEHNPFTLALLRSWAPEVAETRLVGLTLRDYLVRRAERHGGTVLAAVDQAEDLLADTWGARKPHRSRFLAQLTQALADEPRVHLLLLMRQTALDDFAEALPAGLRFGVLPLSAEGALRATAGPAEAAGRPFVPGAAEKLVGDLLTSRLGTSEGSQIRGDAAQIQPTLLQAVCEQLWESLPAGLNEVTERDVRRYGDADTVLAAYCARVIAAVADDHDMPALRLRSWLIDNFLTEHDTLGTAYEGVTHTAGMANAVVRALEDRHLLGAGWRSGSRWYELLSSRLVAPLRISTEQTPPHVTPGEQLRAAERELGRGELDLAERLAREALRASSGADLRLRAEAESLLGNLAYERSMPQDAEGHYRTAATLVEALRDTEGVARQLMAVGRTLLAQSRPADAVRQLRSAADRLPADPVAQIELGWALWQLGQGRGAIAVFSGVLSLEPGNADALRGRGQIHAELGEAADALRDLGWVTPDDRPSVRAAGGLAMAHLGRHGQAGEVIRAALMDAPRNGPVLIYAAHAAALAGDRAEAAALAERAVGAVDPPLPEHLLEQARRLAVREVA